MNIIRRVERFYGNFDERSVNLLCSWIEQTVLFPFFFFIFLRSSFPTSKKPVARRSVVEKFTGKKWKKSETLFFATISQLPFNAIPCMKRQTRYISPQNKEIFDTWVSTSESRTSLWYRSVYFRVSTNYTFNLIFFQ